MPHVPVCSRTFSSRRSTFCIPDNGALRFKDGGLVKLIPNIRLNRRPQDFRRQTQDIAPLMGTDALSLGIFDQLANQYVNGHPSIIVLRRQLEVVNSLLLATW